MSIKKSLIALSLSVYVLNVAGCGVLLYPERQGQTGGKIDPAVAVLDGIGLLLYLIPGLVAFAIDFHQGTIYLPNSQSNIDGADDGFRTVKVEGPMTEENIEATLQKALGVKVDISAENVRAEVIDKARLELIPALARAQSQTQAL